MKPATRERKERFIKSFDGVYGQTIRDRAVACIVRNGWSWLTDEQIDDITADLVSDARFTQRLNIRNHKILKGAA
jgi:hypothetical protein